MGVHDKNATLSAAASECSYAKRIDAPERFSLPKRLVRGVSGTVQRQAYGQPLRKILKKTKWARRNVKMVGYSFNQKTTALLPQQRQSRTWMAMPTARPHALASVADGAEPMDPNATPTARPSAEKEEGGVGRLSS